MPAWTNRHRDLAAFIRAATLIRHYAYPVLGINHVQDHHRTVRLAITQVVGSIL